MQTTDKVGCNILVELLARKGVRRVVLSPGSRNAPLIVAFVREPRIEHFVALDERSAAFMALGMAQQTGEPVALACTSGTALLNYAPAVAEAYYQHIPLIVVSADRPEEWIDQNDSQTICQREVFRNFVKASYVFPAEVSDNSERWYVNRMVNDAVNLAQEGCPGPVHVNIPLREPLYRTTEQDGIVPERVVERLATGSGLDKETVTRLAEEVSHCRRVMILASFGSPDSMLNEALSQLAGNPNIIVLTETIANLHDNRFIPTIDRVLSEMTPEEKRSLAPDLLITFGGSLVSRMVKTWLREVRPAAHWHLSLSSRITDTLQCLTRHIAVSSCTFLRQLADAVRCRESDYARLWQSLRERAARSHETYVDAASWSDMKAFSRLLPALPAGAVLQLSNSTPVRYAQLFEYAQVSRSDCNRGTSGIDGATSTAVGASVVQKGITVFITGDMGFLYDSNALWNQYVTPRLKIVVMCNDGGGIFRFIQGPSELPEQEEFFETSRRVDAEGFARLHGFACWSVSDEQALQEALPAFFAEQNAPALLAVHTPRERNAEVLRDYFKRTNLR
ncbi:MAG: 2-succinyl-5-enolpyruvyl-6-hydroxy-3-cyclohexene-1-carboxylic-acid synthase [Coprobacter sp.]|nr:2-succinyl-5-enolpyruvyl-6-hydroxy-3-cyclohexene-1-carboxylic-acid synthase [Coprobacter sp.]